MTSLRLTQTMRLKTPVEFQRVYARKRSAADPRLVVYVCEPDTPGRTRPRLGVSVSKKVGNAVMRNRVKRQFREAFRLAQGELPVLDYVLIPRLPVTATTAEFGQSLVRLAVQGASRL